MVLKLSSLAYASVPIADIMIGVFNLFLTALDGSGQASLVQGVHSLDLG